MSAGFRPVVAAHSGVNSDPAPPFRYDRLVQFEHSIPLIGGGWQIIAGTPIYVIGDGNTALCYPNAVGSTLRMHYQLDIPVDETYQRYAGDFVFAGIEVRYRRTAASDLDVYLFRVQKTNGLIADVLSWDNSDFTATTSGESDFAGAASQVLSPAAYSYHLGVSMNADTAITNAAICQLSYKMQRRGVV